MADEEKPSWYDEKFQRHKIKADGTDLPNLGAINFKGASVSANTATGAIDVTLTGGGGSSGLTPKAMADADQALTADESKKPFFKTTGALTAKRKLTIAAPASETDSQLGVFLNTCTGASVVVDTPGGKSVEVEPGAKMMVRVTPAGVYPIVDLDLDPRDFGCPWNGVDDDTPGLIAMQQAIPADRSRPTRVSLPKGEAWCADNLPIFRRLNVRGHGSAQLQNYEALINGIRFAPLKGLILHGDVSGSEISESLGYGTSEGSVFDGVSLYSQQAIVSDSAGNFGHSYGQISTSLDTWEQLPTTVKKGCVVIKSGSDGAAITVGSPVGEYYADGLTRNTTHLVMFRCTTSGTKGSVKPAAMAGGSGTGLPDVGTTIAATGGTAVWTVESIPKDYVNGAPVSVGQRVFLPGDNAHVFRCIALNGATSMSAPESTTLDVSMNGLTLLQSTINVADASKFPATGIIRITTSAGYQFVSYAGKTATSFTGCNVVGELASPTGTMSTGGAVSGPYSAAPWGVPVFTQNQMRQPNCRNQFYDVTTYIAGASIGANLPQATINVTSTAGFANAGTLKVWTGAAYVDVTYTGRTDTTFTGCSGGVGTLADAAEVGQGCLWEEEFNGAVCWLATWATFRNATILGFTNGAFWVSPTWKRGWSGGSHYFRIERCYVTYCGQGFKLTSFNANGGKTEQIQFDMLGGGRTNVDGPNYLNIIPSAAVANWGLGRFGNAGDAITDRQLGLCRHDGHYTQFSGGMGYRNDLHGAPTPSGNASVFYHHHHELDLAPVIFYPAIYLTPAANPSSKSNACVFGSDSKNIRASAPLRTTPTSFATTVIAGQDPSVAEFMSMRVTGDSYPRGFGVSEDLAYWAAGWITFGKQQNTGWFNQQSFAIPRDNGMLPGGHSVGALAPMWITSPHFYVGNDPSVPPWSLGMLTGSNRIGVYGEWVQKGSFFFNVTLAGGDEAAGWRALTDGSPGTIQTVYFAKRGEITKAMADANQTATGAQNAVRTHVLTGALTADRKWFLAVPATDADGAEHVIDASGITGANIVVDLVGSVGTTVTVPAGEKATVRTNTGGVKRQQLGGEPPVAMAALDVDWSKGGVFYKTLAAGANAITFSNTIDGATILLELTGAASTVTWPASVKWPGGTAPTQTASGVDVYTFVRRGTSIHGSVMQAMA